MNCSYCHGEFGPLPPIAVFVDTALAGEFCSMSCLRAWVGDDNDNFSESWETYKHIKERA